MGNIKLVYDADEERALRGIQKLVQKQLEAERKFKDVGRAAKGAGTQAGRLGDKAEEMGRKSGAAVNKMKSGFEALGAATGPLAATALLITQIRQGLQDVNAEAARAAESARGSFAGLQKLAQISGGKPEEFQRLISASARISRIHGVPFGDSMAAVFSGRSLQLSLGEIESLSPFGRVADLDPVIGGVGDVYAAFGRKEAGSARDVANKLGVTAAESKVSLQEFAPKLSIIGAASRMIGVGDEEAMAALAYMSAGQGQSAEEGATQIKALMTAIRKSPRELGVRGAGSFVEMVRRIGALPEGDRTKFFTSNVRAAGGLAGLQMKLPSIEALVERLRHEQEVLSGTPGSYMRSTVGVMESSVIGRGLLRERRGKVGRMLGEMALLGEGRLATQATIDEAAAASVQRGEPRFIRAARLRAATRAEEWGLGEGGVDVAERMGGGQVFGYAGPSGTVVGLLISIRDLLAEKPAAREDAIEATLRRIVANPNAGDLD
jgi:hypothetical protein